MQYSFWSKIILDIYFPIKKNTTVNFKIRCAILTIQLIDRWAISDRSSRRNALFGGGGEGGLSEILSILLYRAEQKYAIFSFKKARIMLSKDSRKM
jgi:hypothetical protein